MKLRNILFIGMLLLTAGASAQTRAVRPFEFELHFGADYPLNRLPDTDKSGGPSFGLELRYNIKNSPLDVALLLDFTEVYYNQSNGNEEKLEQCNLTTTIGLGADYNFRQGCNVNPFVGCGIGFGMHDALSDFIDGTNDNRNTMTFAPRVGVELWRHLRVTLSTSLSCKYYSSIGLTVGLVLGGGKKQK